MHENRAGVVSSNSPGFSQREESIYYAFERSLPDYVSRLNFNWKRCKVVYEDWLVVRPVMHLFLNVWNVLGHIKIFWRNMSAKRSANQIVFNIYVEVMETWSK